MKTIKVRDFTEFPGPRFKKLGPYSGQEFRETVLEPAIEEAGPDIEIDLDGTFGYGSSFLEEAFGGLVRRHVITETQAMALSTHIKSEEDPSLAEEVKEYLLDASEASENRAS